MWMFGSRTTVKKVRNSLRTYEGLRGARLVSLVSLCFANFPGSVAVAWCLLFCVFCLFGLCVFVWFVFCCLLAFREISATNSLSILLKIPVVDRQCLVLVRQCRKKMQNIRDAQCCPHQASWCVAFFAGGCLG